jgi:hypothetical protein
MSGKKIFNDPVYGFVTVPYGILFDIIEHPYFQRLRRIKQLSFTHYVYPGALHTRFHHALGALHLMQEALEVLKGKGADIAPDEEEAACIAILLHDIGHGPFSHTLEHSLINISHEALSLLFMERLDDHFAGRLTQAIRIFKDDHPKKFLHQLVSSQLDMDRMDYLNRDSFFTGVSEGVIGYDRIIKMLAVHNGELVIEEKGIYSIEKFLIARRLMYWQVYLHKTVLAAEQMLVKVLQRAKELAFSGVSLPVSDSLEYFLIKNPDAAFLHENRDELLENFARLDDYDIMSALKAMMYEKDEILSYFCKCLINRRLFKIELKNVPFERAYVEEIRQKTAARKDLPTQFLDYLVFEGEESNMTYNTMKEEIKILFKSGKALPMSETADYGIQSRAVTKYYLCHPKPVER